MLRKKRAQFTWLDAVVIVLVLGFAVYVGYRIKVGLNYKWKWSIIPQYIVRFDAGKGRWVSNYILQGLFTTLKLSIWATLVGTLLGTVMGFFRVSKSLFKRLVGRTYVELIRNMPPLVLIFLFYYFVSGQIIPLLGMEEFIQSRSESAKAVLTVLFAQPSLFTEFISAIITVSLFEGAYITEIVRGGIQSIEKGQRNASHALGLSWWQEMRYVVLPQAVKRILPQLAGQFISTIKDSAIVSVISIQELTYMGMQLVSGTYRAFEVWITVTGLYLILTLSLSLAVSRLEIHMQKSD